MTTPPFFPAVAMFGDLQRPSDLALADYQAWHLPVEIATCLNLSAASLALTGIEFMEKRLSANQTLLHELWDCRDVAQAGTLQREWLETAVGHYAGIYGEALRTRQQAVNRLIDDVREVWTLPTPPIEIEEDETPEPAPQQPLPAAA